MRATPVAVDGTTYTVVSLRDVSVEKRCERLEQVFFHDILNTVTGLRGWAGWFGHPGVDRDRAAKRMELLSDRLVREIRDHQALVLAERGELMPSSEPVRPAEVLRDLELLYFGHGAVAERRLEVSSGRGELELETDPALLTRVLVNMVQNALEAVPPGGAVRVACEPVQARQGEVWPAAVRFTVQNDGEIPAEVQARIFQRCFSTKAARGRGFGTYGMKLLGERYLGGQVSFSSWPGTGTVFELRLPCRPSRQQSGLA